MATQPNRGNERRYSRLNFREVYPVQSVLHPEPLKECPSDALAVLWLDSEGVNSHPRFAYLNRARALHLMVQLHRLLNPGEHPAHQRESATERARRYLRLVDQTGEASGA